MFFGVERLENGKMRTNGNDSKWAGMVMSQNGLFFYGPKGVGLG